MKTNKTIKIKLIFGICISSVIIIALIVLLLYFINTIRSNYYDDVNSNQISGNTDILPTEYTFSPNNDNIANIGSEEAFIYDMGLITNISDMLWLDDNRFLVIGVSEYNNINYVWVFENNISENTTCEKAIIKLDNENYSSIKKLDDNRVVITTTKRIIFLNDELFESRSIIISPKDNNINEVNINNDGTAIIYTNNSGLYYKNLETKKTTFIIGTNEIGENSNPYGIYFCDNNNIAFHYITSDLKLYCAISDTNGNYTVFDNDVNYLNYITKDKILFISKENRNTLISIDTKSKKEVHYNFNNFTPLSLTAQNDNIYLCGNSDNGDIYSLNIINDNTMETKVSINNKDNVHFSSFIALSPSGRIAAVQYSVVSENNKILILG